ADKIVNHKNEPVILIAHKNKEKLLEAMTKIRLVEEPLPCVLNIDESLKKKQIIWGKDNILKEYLLAKGDIDKALSRSQIIIEGEYTTGAQEHAYIEPNGVIATYHKSKGVLVEGSMQCPYYIKKALKIIFNLPDDKVRVKQTITGGAFGGKEDYPSILSAHAALLSYKSSHPVKMIYDRGEDMAATTKRHPSKSKYRIGVKKDGTITALDVDFVLDGGAYATLSSVVLSRGIIHAAGPYNWPALRVRGRAVATNSPPNGAFRGFGVPQSCFATERFMDKVAKKIRMDPIEFRRKNFLRCGDSMATGQVIKEDIDMSKLLDHALKASGYKEKIQKYQNDNNGNKIKKGIGVAAFMHGAGFTGSGEEFIGSIVKASADKKGYIHIYVSTVEMGQGMNTVFSQIAAEESGVPIEKIIISEPDTSMVPNSGPTVASRTVMIVGELIRKAVRQIIDDLQKSKYLKKEYSSEEFRSACTKYFKKNKILEVEKKYKQPSGISWDDKKYQGEAYGTYAWAVYVSEVAVDTVTFQTTVTDFTAVQE
ncbi:MAG: molybdopterin-dependent oxidoreductase, partial [Phycisphaeraceae bacterium]|nr:molybdopterin-dependent oxidoreductase [Phycisphaeraceae bacterium]